MRLLWMTSIAMLLTLYCFSHRTAQGSGLGEGTVLVNDPLEGVKYEPARLPLSAKSARTWIILLETMVKPPPDKTSFAEVIRILRDATRGENGKGAPLKLYVDPTSLNESEISMATEIPAPFVGQNEVSLHIYLKFLLRPFGLAHRVHDDLVVIDSPCDDCPAPVEVTAAEAWAWLLLHEEVPLHFPNETPLVDVIKAIQRGTIGKGAGGRGLVIYLDLVGLRGADKAPDSPVTIVIDGVPVCTSLSLVLNQLRLGFHVSDDGVLVVTHFTASDEAQLMDESGAIEAYQLLRYDLFWERQNQKIATSKRDHRLRPLKDCPRRPQESDNPR